LIKKLPNKAEKEIKLQLKFGQSVDDNKKAFNDLLFEATQVSDKTADAAATQIIKTIDSKFKGAKGQFAGLRAALQTAIADPNTPEALKTLLMNFNWDTVGSTTGTKIGAGIKSGLVAAVNAGAGLANFWETAGGTKGGLVVPVATPVIPAPDTKTFDEGVKKATTALSSISKTIPKATINIDDGLGMIGELKRAWDRVAGQIQKKVPKITVNADQALDMIGETKRGWDKAASQIEKKVPKLKVNADQALDMIGEVTRGLQKIKDKTVTVTVKQSGSGLRTAQHGMHEMLAQDTLIQAHKGERVDIGSGSGETRPSPPSSGGGGGHGGNDTFLFNLHFGDKEIVRKVKRELGRQVYSLGA